MKDELDKLRAHRQRTPTNRSRSTKDREECATKGDMYCSHTYDCDAYGGDNQSLRPEPIMDDLIVRLSRKRFFRTQWFEPKGEIDVPVPADMAEWEGVQSENVNPDGPAAVARLAALEAENASLKAQLATVEAETLERAAKVADEYNDPHSAPMKRHLARAIAFAIRTLKNKDTDHDAG